MPNGKNYPPEAKGDSPTRSLFDCLARLYKQGQLLLMDADRLMAEQGWEPMDTRGPGDVSMSLNYPKRWYARWATRFYLRTLPDEEPAVDRLLFVSVHFASDHDTDVHTPLVSAGRLLYGAAMSVEMAHKSYAQYMCKYWFWSQPHETLEAWRQWRGQSKWFANLKGSDMFAVPLFDITSSGRLQELVIDPLLSQVDMPTGLNSKSQDLP